MNSWFYKNLGDAMLVGDQSEQIEQGFMAAYLGAGSPKDMAVFIRHESEGRLHCEVQIYFSPRASRVALEFDAQPCEKPCPDGLSKLVGSPESWEALFPEKAC